MNKKTQLVIQIVKYDFILFTTRSSIDGTLSSFKRFCSLYSEIPYKMTSATFDMKIVPQEIRELPPLNISYELTPKWGLLGSSLLLIANEFVLGQPS